MLFPQNGPDEEVLKLKGPNTNVMDLKGRTVMPGFVDTHRHMYNSAENTYGGGFTAAQLNRFPVDWRGVRSKDDVIAIEKLEGDAGATIVFDQVLALVAALVALVAAGSVLASIYNSMADRRRERGQHRIPYELGPGGSYLRAVEVKGGGVAHLSAWETPHQGTDAITSDPGSVVLIAVPLLVYFAVMWFTAMASSRALGLPYARSATVAFTAAGNNFELAIAVSIGVWGVTSGEALAGVIGPLIEVPALVALVYVSLWLRRRWTWKPSPAPLETP